APSNSELGHTLDTKIQVSSNLSKQRRELVLRHELAHVFFNQYCPALKTDVLTQETFAYFVSKDYQRIFFEKSAQAADFVFAIKAMDHLRTWNAQKGLFALPTALALSRVLIEQADKSGDHGMALTERFRKLFASCASADFSAQNASQAFAEFLVGDRLERKSYSNEDGLVVMDGLSGLPILQKGNLSQKLQPGSLLKALLVATAPSLREQRSSRQSDSWVCDPEGREEKWNRSWSWKEALIKSCNGFFLDAPMPPEAELRKYQSVLMEIGVQELSSELPPSLAHTIGLLPGVEMTPLQLAQTFRWISLQQPEVIEALKETSRQGTLMGFPESKWFSDHGISLKSGTVRDALSQPMIGWVAAISNEKFENEPAWIAIYFRKGKAPREMLWELKEQLKPLVGMKAERQPVQILGLVPENQIQIHCDHPRIDVKASEMKVGETLDCRTGPFEISYPLKSGLSHQRSYYGRLRKKIRPELAKQKFTRGQQAKARSGSSLMLETSKLNYSLQVLASEFPRGRQETLKALALAAQANARSQRHGKEALCDTTHCQVFGGEWSKLPMDLKKNVLDAVLSVDSRKLQKGVRQSENWFPYSLGGTEAWSQAISADKLASIFQISRPDHLELQKGEIELRQSSNLLLRVDCETFRNQMQLLACPDSLKKATPDWVALGKGEGHQLGMNLRQADAMASQGIRFDEVLRKFYPKAQLF
ncbi:MAG: SpoIID/LytB domain-containing protein, partial [Pseudobdellovibrionaceae bacterium]